MKPQRLTRIADFLLYAGALVCLGLLASVFVRRNLHSPGALWKYYIASFAGLLFFLFSLRWSEKNRVKFALLCCSTLLSLYLAEAALVILFGPTTKFQVTEELIARGIDASPVINPSVFIPTDGLNHVFPFAGQANKQAVYCNESGRFSMYTSDEHGFNNPKWQSNPEIVLIGDSFSQGACVDSGDDIAGQLRKPGTSVLTLGTAGAGPLIELAILREYAVGLKPNILLWIYYEGNDLVDLKSEETSAMLKRYVLDDGFSQNLIGRQTEIDAILRDYVAQASEDETKKTRERRPAEIAAAIKLSALRSRLMSILVKDHTLYDIAAVPDDDFTAVLRKANEYVKDWGGRMYFVYLPGYGRYNRPVDENNFCRRRQVIDLVGGLNIPLIDAQQVFAAHRDPLSLFPNRKLGHYTPEGYRLVANYIRERLLVE